MESDKFEKHVNMPVESSTCQSSFKQKRGQREGHEQYSA